MYVIVDLAKRRQVRSTAVQYLGPITSKGHRTTRLQKRGIEQACAERVLGAVLG